jgi:hypothetical protein
MMARRKILRVIIVLAPILLGLLIVFVAYRHGVQMFNKEIQTDTRAWSSWRQRQPISISFDKQPLKNVAQDVFQQVDVSLSPNVSIFLNGKVISGHIRESTFWPAMVEIAELADAEMTVCSSFRQQTQFSFKKRSSELSAFHLYSFVEPFCFELSRLSAAPSQEPIKNTWRFRSLGLPEDGETSVKKIVVTDRQTAETMDCELLVIDDHARGVVRTIRGGTYDDFFKVPQQMEKHGFRCKVFVFVNEVTERTWVKIPLRQGAEVRLKDATVRIEQILVLEEEISVDFRMTWAQQITANAIAERRRLIEKLEAEATNNRDAIQWVDANRGSPITVRNSSYSPALTDQTGIVSLSQSQFNLLNQTEMPVQISISKTLLPPDINSCTLSLQLAKTSVLQKEVSFAVPAIEK